MVEITGLVKVAISIVIIGLMEMSIIKRSEACSDYFELAMCILMGAWILREGW